MLLRATCERVCASMCSCQFLTLSQVLYATAQVTGWQRSSPMLKPFSSTWPRWPCLLSLCQESQRTQADFSVRSVPTRSSVQSACLPACLPACLSVCLSVKATSPFQLCHFLTSSNSNQLQAPCLYPRDTGLVMTCMSLCCFLFYVQKALS